MKLATKSVIVCFLFVLTCGGCGKSVDLGSPVSVSGSVTLDGKPLAKAAVGFNAISKGLPAKYRYVSAFTDDGGNFTMERVYPAEYEVTLAQEDPSAPAIKDAAVSGNPKLAKYAGNSPLRANVSAESTTFKLEATSGR